MPALSTAKQIQSTIEKLVARFDWSAAWTDPIVERTWIKAGSGNHFALIATPGHDSIVLKFFNPTSARNAGFGADEASAITEAMNHFAALLAECRSIAASSPRPVGWLDDPPVVASVFCAGTRLTEILRDPDHAVWESSEAISRWVELAGAALAVWHADRLDAAASRDSAFIATESTMRRLRLSSVHSRTLLEYLRTAPEMIVRLYQDFGPGNVLGVPDGSIAVFDPPAHTRLGPRQRDVADFLFGLDMTLAGQAVAGERAAPREHRTVLRKAFVRGYQEASGIDPLAGCGGRVLALFEAARSFGMVRKRATTSGVGELSRRRRWISAAWAARNGVAHRIAVTRRMGNVC